MYAIDSAASTFASTARSRVRTTNLVALGILIIGAALRFMQLGQIRYGYDHSYPAYQALGLLDAGIWPIIGQPSSVFLDNPVLMSYLQAMPLMIWRSPLAVQVFILLFNTGAIWLVYRAAQGMLGDRAGLIAAFLFAVSPWVVYFSRTTWVQSLVPFLMAAAAWGLWPAFVDDGTPGWRFLLGALAVIAVTQTYIQAWGVLPGIMVLLIVARRRIPRRALLAAVAVFSVATLVFAAGLVSDSAANAAKVRAFTTGGEFHLTTEGAEHVLRLVNGLEFVTAQTNGPITQPLWQAAKVVALVGLGAALATGIVLAILALRTASRERRVAVVLLVWLGLPTLLTVVAGSQPVHPHYLLLTLPAGQVLAAWALASVCTCRAYTSLVVGFLLLTGAGFAHDLVSVNDTVAANPIWPNYDGWSLAAAATLGEAIAGQLEPPTPGAPVRLAAHGHSAILSGMSGRYVRTVGEGAWPDFVLLPESGTLTYVAEGAAPVPDWLRAAFASPDQSVNPAPESTFTLYTAMDGAGKAATGETNVPVGWTSESGLTLDCYQLLGEARPGQALDLILVWRVDELSPDRGDWYVASNVHMLGSDGELLANLGSDGQWAHHWLHGDTYVERYSIPIRDSAAAGNIILSVGLNDPVRGVDYRMFDHGQPVARYEIRVPISS